MIAACPGPGRRRADDPDAGSARVEHPEGDRPRRDRVDLPDDSRWPSGARGRALLALPPFGRRSSGAGQAGRVWSKVPGGYQNTFNDNMLVVMMIETLDGILNADEIATTFGVDVVIQGNNDLARFSGWAQNDPRYQALLTVSRNATLQGRQVLGQCRAAVPHRQSAQRRTRGSCRTGRRWTAGRRPRADAATLKSRRSEFPASPPATDESTRTVARFVYGIGLRRTTRPGVEAESGMLLPAGLGTPVGS